MGANDLKDGVARYGKDDAEHAEQVPCRQDDEDNGDRMNPQGFAHDLRGYELPFNELYDGPHDNQLQQHKR
ncbi:hypothetical protein D3C77_609720 [compost metagenome]